MVSPLLSKNGVINLSVKADDVSTLIDSELVVEVDVVLFFLEMLHRLILHSALYTFNPGLTKLLYIVIFFNSVLV
ncbi:hypothetical protein COU14_02845 [Candidatus Kaiserbacteria bacterium CG10_big_fil_rev_8_21_14_0_10_44_10]|uniref:Uncharacterized protein n=1 Tax=Candidatus Kaiserbacteria bacterium CG10_big_fil_rev_8_21_14_0_10_44_10 TaxID=1974606 RepID=A0A2H0UH45_9BACT|nr:MAG: hypothetical protein COU14_02845 [Candidatus Kaiserbacteria bacterium CG10_big_fil_rev_8_21_14_0_10_44_10]